MISYKGIDEAVLLHALYHATRPLGFGKIHDRPDLTIDDVRADLGQLEGRDRTERFDYYRERPFKFRLDLKAKQFDELLYDRDAGEGAAARVVKKLGGDP